MHPVVAQSLELGLIVIAALAVLAGIPTLIVVLVRRSNRRQRAALQSAAHAPGWYPSPQLSGQMQWWNGTSWAHSFTPPASQ